MIDPIELSVQVRNQVCKNGERKYYRFRKTKFYGGCATADCLGCNLRCVYCWAQKKVWNPNKFGEFYTSKEISQKLLNMKMGLIRISGGEPTLSKNHLLNIISLIPKNFLFILETNGVLLDESYIKDLSKFENLYVRVSLKGVDEFTFEKITGANGKYFNNQIMALKFLNKYKVKNRAAISINLFTDEQIQNLGISNLEFEHLIEYPFVMKRLKKRGIKIINRER